MKTRFVAFAMLLPMFGAAAANLQCSQDARTDAMQCVDTQQVRERDGIRYARLYTGGPNSVRSTSYTIHANCKTGVVHLKDADGVSFGGGTRSATQAVGELFDLLCAASVRKK